MAVEDFGIPLQAASKKAVVDIGPGTADILGPMAWADFGRVAEASCQAASLAVPGAVADRAVAGAAYRSAYRHDASRVPDTGHPAA